ncbi:HemK family methyltransferase [Echria macrotheca]|uniref:HemK family methyltransferase n=1 Tax=Echria macrotheca TaxID=438768 RepID=A0AAJ0FF39_9PEZI|nr:HemK family methyltransferase [Echria macrotheca]
MPRLRPSLFWQARHKISPQSAPLLNVCRDLPSTAAEFRWIRQHIASFPSPIPPVLRLHRLCALRARGVPLQYVLGTQPFGDLEILCRPGVLIPRPETEAYTLLLGQILSAAAAAAAARDFSQKTQILNVLDICTGTGCIPLQLHASLHNSNNASSNSSKKVTTKITSHIHGVDISSKAIALARRNLAHNFPTFKQNQEDQKTTGENKSTITFHKHDIFSPSFLSDPTIFPEDKTEKAKKYDLLISNPPYISPRAFATQTARSVRNYEPRLALVPSPSLAASSYPSAARQEDVFYARLVDIVSIKKPRRVLFEVAGWEQALRVVGMVLDDMRLRGENYTLEIWRDWPDGSKDEVVEVDGVNVRVRGEGDGRAVYLYQTEEGC